MTVLYLAPIAHGVGSDRGLSLDKSKTVVGVEPLFRLHMCLPDRNGFHFPRDANLEALTQP